METILWRIWVPWLYDCVVCLFISSTYRALRKFQWKKEAWTFSLLLVDHIIIFHYQAISCSFGWSLVILQYQSLFCVTIRKSLISVIFARVYVIIILSAHAMLGFACWKILFWRENICRVIQTFVLFSVSVSFVMFRWSKWIKYNWL